MLAFQEGGKWTAGRHCGLAAMKQPSLFVLAWSQTQLAVAVLLVLVRGRRCWNYNIISTGATTDSLVVRIQIHRLLDSLQTLYRVFVITWHGDGDALGIGVPNLYISS
jgi:hypothetical protein